MICKSKVFGILPPPHDLIIFDFSLFDLADMRPTHTLFDVQRHRFLIIESHLFLAFASQLFSGKDRASSATSCPRC